MAKIKWEQTEKQKEAWAYLADDVTTEIVFGGGAGGAKSFLGCAWIIKMAITYKGTRWLIGRKKLKRLKETTLKTFFEVCHKWGLKQGVHFTYNAQDGLIKFINKSEVLLADLAHQPSDPNYDELGSLELTGAFIDEVNQITFKAWEVIKSRIRFKLDEYGLIPKLLGTCNPSKGWVYTYFYKPFKDGILERGKAFIRALAKDNPFISKHYIAQLKAIKDKNTRERLLNGNWEYDDDPACLFDLDVIQDQFKQKVNDKRDRWLTGDVSRKGRDNMPVGLWEGLQLVKVFIIPYEIRSSTLESAKYIKKLAQKYKVRTSHIILDEDGVGGGVVDNIKGCIGFINGSSPVLTKQDELRKKRGEFYENYGNLKTQCYFKLAEVMEAGELGVDEEAFDSKAKDEYIEELGQIKQRDVDKDGKIYLVGKDKIKENIGRSPDYADMVMMRMYSLVKPKRVLDIITLE
ncbi:MAG: hypothetical protein EOL88_00590 [Bacteroidia bacterium]|nr:hypothetical protein [Bacteroidia bacterium]